MNNNKLDNRLIYLIINKRHIILMFIFIIIIIINIVFKNKAFGFAEIITILGFLSVLFITILTKKYRHYK
ncbi:hypothetical protein GCM10007380_20550 [Gottfriedia solisilvae]|uniref:Uncharacterized protein n=1 Tax=Gottfriedia solisilvae TaxID=1516104 RepID=A0A8J3AHI8_9BACI|nr:hypothetical protein GCM10007380_20550 [Gottfriedia solisilvae]